MPMEITAKFVNLKRQTVSELNNFDTSALVVVVVDISTRSKATNTFKWGYNLFEVFLRHGNLAPLNHHIVIDRE